MNSWRSKDTATLAYSQASGRKVRIIHCTVGLYPLLANGKVKPIIERVYAMEEIGEAHRAMRENRNLGKLIVRIE